MNPARHMILAAAICCMAPAFATIVTVMIFNYLGDCVRDSLDVGGER